MTSPSTFNLTDSIILSVINIYVVETSTGINRVIKYLIYFYFKVN